MSWNYRIIKENFSDYDEASYTIHEVYYEPNGNIISWSEHAIYAKGDAAEELKSDLEMQIKAFDKPILEIVTINGKKQLIEASMSEALE